MKEAALDNGSNVKDKRTHRRREKKKSEGEESKIIMEP